VLERLRVFQHVGFFCLWRSERAATTKAKPWPISKGRLSMYIGGGLLTLVVIIVLVVILLRR